MTVNPINSDALQRACHSLEVFSYGQSVGVIENIQGDFTFRYHSTTGPAHFVSLLMPVRNQVYKGRFTRQLPPVFDMNLPEGGLRQALINRYAKVVSGFNDLAMLYLVGRNTIGHVTFGAPEQGAAAKLDLDTLMDSHDTEELLSKLYEGDAILSGIAGAQPKVLAGLSDSDVAKFSDSEVRGQDMRKTFRSDSAIVKASGPDTPWLAANEFFCLRAARLAGLSVPETRLFRDGQILIVSRFDRDDQGAALGAEDFCSLNALTSTEKYSSTYEKMAKTIKMFSSPPSAQSDLKTFFKSLVLSCALRNGDAHAKNFTLLHKQSSADDSPAVWLSPAYDICTTNAYLKEDMLALTLSGSKRYPTRKKLDLFGRQACAMVDSIIRQAIEEVAYGVNQAAQELTEYSEIYPQFHAQVGAKMLNCWAAGLGSVDEHLAIDASWLELEPRSNLKTRPTP